MNYQKLGKILGKIMILEGVLMLAPFAVSLIYREGLRHALAFAVPVLLLVALGAVLQLPQPRRQVIYQKEGFALVGLVWIVMTLFGALPFVINGEIPHYIDACFEIMSGFTTTGASVVADITVLSHSSLFWRSFSHWIGGMGVLVFVLIFIPESNEGSSMHLLRAESPGPSVGKIASRMKVTTRILYLIYLGMTALEVIILMLDKPIPGYEQDHFFISLLTTFGTAGTGGFGVIPGSLELYNPFSQYVVATFLILFGINFSLYYLLLLGKVREILRSEEFRTYLVIAFGGVLWVFFSLLSRLSSLPMDYTAEEAFRHSYFQVASLVTTAGFSTTDFQLWPQMAQTLLILLMFVGSMAGSTAGGLKTSRLVIACKGMVVNLRRLISPHYVPKTKMEGKTLSERTVADVFSYFTLYAFLFLSVLTVLSFDPVCGQTVTVVSDGGVYTVTHGFFTNFSATLSCISNIGPGFEAVGPYLSFAGYSYLSKVLLTLTMLLGRLEILPILILFHPKTWRRV